MDHGIVTKTATLYSIPKEIRDIPPVCQTASLNNICYLREVIMVFVNVLIDVTKTLCLFKELELGVSGIIKKVPTVIPSASVVERCSELISDNDKIHFQIEDKVSNILMGDLILYKNGETKSLRNVLCTEGLVIVNEKFFESKFFQKCFNSY